MALTKKEQAFKLFDQGLGASSREVRDLELKNTTRNCYMSEWRKLRGGGTETKSSGGAAGATVGGAKTKLPGGETIAMIKEKPAVVKPAEPESEELFPKEKEEPKAETNRESIVKEEEEEEEETEAKSNGGGAQEKIGVIKAAKGVGGGKTLEEQLSSVIEDGLVIQVTISSKTMVLYHVARAMQHNHGKELSLGDFIDDAAEDMFAGRGLELGLINTKTKEVQGG